MATEDYVDDATKESASTLKNDFAKLRNDLYGLFQDAIGFGKSGAGNASSKFNEGKEALRGQYEHGKEALRGQYESAKEYGIDGIRSVEDKIEKNPLAAVAIAAGVGLILGGLLRRR